MDDVYVLLVTVDYPDALTGGLRRTTDALRAVLERTRGDVTNALVAARLRAAMGDTPPFRDLRVSQGPRGRRPGPTTTLDLGLAPPRRIPRAPPSPCPCSPSALVTARRTAAPRSRRSPRGRGRGRPARGVTITGPVGEKPVVAVASRCR